MATSYDDQHIESTLAATVTYNVTDLAKTHPMAVHELVELCRNPEHKLFGSTARTLREEGLLESNGTVHSAIRDVVLKIYGVSDAS